MSDHTYVEFGHVNGDRWLPDPRPGMGTMQRLVEVRFGPPRPISEPVDSAPLDVVADTLRDLAEHGLRADLTPTVMFGDESHVYRQLTDYLRRLDSGLRERARAALDPQPEPCPSVSPCCIPSESQEGQR